MSFGVNYIPSMDEFIPKAFTKWTYLVSGINVLYSGICSGSHFACFIPAENVRTRSIGKPHILDAFRTTLIPSFYSKKLEHSLVIFGMPFGIYSGPVLHKYIQKAFTNWTYLVSGINIVWSTPKNGPNHACIRRTNFTNSGRPHVLHIFINHNT
jgi:hypothetical protein